MENLILIAVHLILMASFALLPYMSRKDIIFGVKVPTSAQTDEAMLQLKRRFIIEAIIVGVSMIIIQLIVNTVMMILITLGVSLVLYTFVYIRTYHKALEIKVERQWLVSTSKVTIDTNFRKKRLTIKPIWYLCYVLMIAGSILLTVIKYNDLPDVLKVKVNTLGEVSQTMPKNKAIVMLIGVQIFILLMMVLIQYIIKHAKQDLSSENIQESLNTNINFRHNFSILFFVFGLVMGFISLISLMFSFEMIENVKLYMALTVGVSLIMIIPILYFSVKFGQDGTKLMTETSDVIEKEDDCFWKWGMLYYNSNDPAVWVSKRVGAGWTLNHARWQAWLFYVAIIGFIVVALVKAG